MGAPPPASLDYSVKVFVTIEPGTSVDGWAIKSGVICPQVDPTQRPQWPETIFLILNKTRVGYTLEAPSDFPLATRVSALVKGVRAVLDLLSSSRPSSRISQGQ